jgi:hypothetical protein
MLGWGTLHFDGGFLIYIIMAKDKNSFLIYCDIIHTVEKLTDEQSGKLFKHLLKYVNDLNPIPEDIVTEIAFEPIKQSLKRDLLKYNDKSAKNAENGRKGAEKRWNKNNESSQTMATIANAIIPMAKMADSDSDSDITNNSDKNGGWEKVIGLFPPTKQNGIIDAAIVWNSLEQKQKQSVMRHLNPYIKNTEERFMKQIGNYFNERMWENMKSKPVSSKIKMLDYNFIEWIKEELEFERFDEARTYLASLQVNDRESFNDLENEYKQLKNN